MFYFLFFALNGFDFVMGADHYVFPEDCGEVEADVVRTVEEENLFTVAFPDIVQLFHKETAEAKDNKLKSMSLSLSPFNSFYTGFRIIGIYIYIYY